MEAKVLAALTGIGLLLTITTHYEAAALVMIALFVYYLRKGDAS